MYNVTVKVNYEVHEEWLQWMKEKHIPDVMNTGCFSSYKITRIVEEPDEHGVGFAIQYESPGLSMLQKYMTIFAKNLQEEHSQKYLGQYVAFRTVLEVLTEG